MTAATPRVRVTMKGPGRIDGRMVAEYRCGACGRAGWNDHQTILERAVDHAATCPALRLAALLAELRALRDRLRQWGYADQALATKVGNTYLEGFGRAREITADDLDGIIREATR